MLYLDQIEDEAQLILIVADILLAAFQLLGLAPHHEEAQLDFVVGIIEGANIAAAVGVEVNLHIAHAIGEGNFALAQLLHLVRRLPEQQADLLGLLLALVQLLAHLLLQGAEVLGECFGLWGR